MWCLCVLCFVGEIVSATCGAQRAMFLCMSLSMMMICCLCVVVHRCKTGGMCVFCLGHVVGVAAAYFLIVLFRHDMCVLLGKPLQTRELPCTPFVLSVVLCVCYMMVLIARAGNEQDQH